MITEAGDAGIHCAACKRVLHDLLGTTLYEGWERTYLCPCGWETTAKIQTGKRNLWRAARRGMRREDTEHE